MAQSVYRANLSAADFPLVNSFQGRTAIAAGIDQNFNRQLVAKQDRDKDILIQAAPKSKESKQSVA